MYPINITEYLERTVEKYPEHIAVRDNGESLTFRQLHERVLALAWQLREALKGENDKIIAVCMPKCLNAVIADLAILYSGNAYMNLDVKAPPARINAILENCQPALCLTENADNAIDSKWPCIPMPANIAPLSAENWKLLLHELSKLIDTDLLCLINTSGSTGLPKTVALNHRSFIDFMEAIKYEKLAGREIIGSLSPIIFDIFSYELCLMMAEASTLVLIPDKFAAFPLRMLELMQKEQVSFIFWVPTIMVNIASMKLLDQIALPDLKMIWFAGEVFPTSKFNYWREKLKNAVFANFYGPIEITLDCLYHVIDKPLDPGEPIPIGKPFRNTAILVLDENQREIKPTMPLVEGELCVRGSSLAMGYYNNAEKTDAVFVQNPLNRAYPETIYRTGDIVFWNTDGELVFRGRKDTLIKHSGYRIELGEIEHAAINALAEITNACALYDKGKKEICLVYEAPDQLDIKQIRHELGKFLPKYMLPRRYDWLGEMPRNTNGKIDRKLLADKFTGGELQ